MFSQARFFISNLVNVDLVKLEIFPSLKAMGLSFLSRAAS